MSIEDDEPSGFEARIFTTDRAAGFKNWLAKLFNKQEHERQCFLTQLSSDLILEEIRGDEEEADAQRRQAARDQAARNFVEHHVAPPKPEWHNALAERAESSIQELQDDICPTRTWSYHDWCLRSDRMHVQCSICKAIRHVWVSADGRQTQLRELDSSHLSYIIGVMQRDPRIRRERAHLIEPLNEEADRRGNVADRIPVELGDIEETKARLRESSKPIPFPRGLYGSCECGAQEAQRRQSAREQASVWSKRIDAAVAASTCPRRNGEEVQLLSHIQSGTYMMQIDRTEFRLSKSKGNPVLDVWFTLNDRAGTTYFRSFVLNDTNPSHVMGQRNALDLFAACGRTFGFGVVESIKRNAPYIAGKKLYVIIEPLLGVTGLQVSTKVSYRKA